MFPGNTHLSRIDRVRVDSLVVAPALTILGQPGAARADTGPLATTPVWRTESNQVSAFYGGSVASAGDVNGDGLSDVIAGAHDHENGERSEGAAFVYLAVGSSSPAGHVPDGSDGLPLTVANAGSEITLAWSPSCLAGDDDYEIYEGTVGDFTSHVPIFCTTDGATSKTFLPSAADRYYLVVPRNATREGSYGETSPGIERPAGVGACLPREVATCP